MSRLARKPPTHPEYHRLQLLGRGTTAEVWRVEKNGSYYALKEIKPKLAEDFRWEKLAVSLHAELCEEGHENILAMFDHWDENDDTIYQVFELCTETYDRWLTTNVPRPDFLTDVQIWKFVRDVAAGLECIHRHGMIHSDIKPANILLCCDSFGQPTYKIADFGLLCLDESAKDEDKCGDPLYIAPECDLPRFELTQKADIYAFGLSIFEAAFDVELPTGELRKQIRADADRAIKLGLKVNPNVSDELVSLLRRILSPEHDSRPSASEILLVASAVYSRLSESQEAESADPFGGFLSPSTTFGQSLSCSPPRTISPCSPNRPMGSALRKRRERPRAIPFLTDDLCADDQNEEPMPSSPIPTRPRRRSISSPVVRRAQRTNTSLFHSLDEE